MSGKPESAATSEAQHSGIQRRGDGQQDRQMLPMPAPQGPGKDRQELCPLAEWKTGEVTPVMKTKREPKATKQARPTQGGAPI